MSHIDIQPLTRELAVEHGPVLLTLNPDSDWEYWTMENMLAERDDKWRFSLIAFDGPRPVGYAITSRVPTGAHMHHLVVAADWRPRGLGIRLMARTAQTLAQAEISNITLKVYRHNERVWKMHQLLGFQMSDGPNESLVFLTNQVDNLLTKVKAFVPAQ